MCDALLAAVKRCDLSAISSIVESMQNKEETCVDRLDQSALAIAAENGSLGIVQKLHRHGYSLEHKNKFGGTALASAAWKGHARVVSYILDNGANPAPFDYFGVSPVHKAASFGYREVLAELICPPAVSLQRVAKRQSPVSVNITTKFPTAPPEFEAMSLLQVLI
jgi:ankyrin repeat protein